MMCSRAGVNGPSVGCWLCDPRSRDGPVGCLEGRRYPWGLPAPLLPRGVLGQGRVQTPELGNGPRQTPVRSEGLWCLHRAGPRTSSETPPF